MGLILRLLVVLSGLIEGGLGVWFVAAGSGHPFLRWLLESPAGSQTLVGPVRFIGYFLALACFLAAALHFIIWRWLQDERDEAYLLINVYGGFLLLGGIALFAAFSKLESFGAALYLPAWTVLLADSLRGVALLAISNSARFSANTLSELRLPSARERSRPRSEVAARDESREPRRRSSRRREGRSAATARSGRGAAGAAVAASPPVRKDDEPAREREGVRTERRVAEGPGDRAGEPGRGRSRGRRGGRRGRGGRPPASETPAVRAAQPDRGEEGVGHRPLPGVERDAEQRGPRPSEPGRFTHPSRSTAGAREDRSSFRARPPRSSRMPMGAVRPPSERMAAAGREGERSGEPGPSAAEIVRPAEFGEIVAGRRRKRGRYSITGALFRPREKRVHRRRGG